MITLYWLGRKAQSDPDYNGPYLNLKAFEKLLGQALTKVRNPKTKLNKYPDVYSLLHSSNSKQSLGDFIFFLVWRNIVIYFIFFARYQVPCEKNNF